MSSFLENMMAAQKAVIADFEQMRREQEELNRVSARVMLGDLNAFDRWFENEQRKYQEYLGDGDKEGTSSDAGGETGGPELNREGGEHESGAREEARNERVGS